MEKDYGLLAFDIPHRLVTSFIYELPFGEGRTFQPGGALGAIARDWSVNGILTLSDGRPFTVTTTDQAGHGTGPHRARELRRRRGAERLQPDARFVDGSGGVRADDGEDVRELREQHGARTGIEVDEPVGVPIDPPRRRAARRDPRRDVQPVQLGELRVPGVEHLEPGDVRTHHQLASVISARFSWRSSSISDRRTCHGGTETRRHL